VMLSEGQVESSWPNLGVLGKSGKVAIPSDDLRTSTQTPELSSRH